MSNKHLNIKVSERQSWEGSILEEDKLSFLMCQPKNNYFQSDKKQCKLDWAQGLFYSTAGTLPLSSAPEIITHRYLFFVSTPGCATNCLLPGLPWYKSSYFVILSWNSINNSTLKWSNYLFAIFGGFFFFTKHFLVICDINSSKDKQIGSDREPISSSQSILLFCETKQRIDGEIFIYLQPVLHISYLFNYSSQLPHTNPSFLKYASC